MDDALRSGRRPRWFMALLRWWALKAVEGQPGGNALWPIAALSACWLAAWVAIDHWQRQPAPRFAAEGIPLLGWYALGVLCLAALLARACRPRVRGRAALVLALGLAPLPLLLVSVLAYVLEGRGFWYASAAVAGYCLAYLARGLRGLSGASQRRAALLGTLFVAAFIWMSDALDAIPDVWTPQDAQPAVSEDELAQRETALFEQAARIDAALESVQRGDEARPQAFFLGFAGVGEEKVFAQEIELAADVTAERFGTGSRRLALINDERDLDGAPLASVSGLSYALQGLAQRMELEQDVLVLAISSHGSQEPSIEVANSQIPLQSLSADELADSLRRAGIRWRVIIISACYAGGYIDALRDPRTVVITAAAADRTSFGCSSDADLTYFGEAFYRDALPHARSLREAFEVAKLAIDARERREHFTPSNPQAFFGAEIEPRIDAMLQQRATVTAGLPPPRQQPTSPGLPLPQPRGSPPPP